MNTARRSALIALTTAAVLWGTAVPLSKSALSGLGPLWLTVFRFGVSGLLLLATLRPSLRGTFRPNILIWGAIGYGGSIAVQNLGIARTSVTHAALIIGTVPVVVAVMAVVFQKARVSAIAWGGFAVSTAGIALVAGAGGGSSSLAGDALVLLSVLIGSAFTIVQARILPGSDVIAISAAQFLAAAVGIAPIALLSDGLPAPSAQTLSNVLAAVALAVVGTAIPYTLFAYGQTMIDAEVAGAFVNLETLVSTALGIVVFGETVTSGQLVGAVGLLAGIYLSTVLAARPLPASWTTAWQLWQVRSEAWGARMDGWKAARAEAAPVRPRIEPHVVPFYPR
jgi:drug/metabolite transporter (DMT)-like permease